MRYTRSEKPIPITRKQSFKAFMKAVWVLSQTNMHYRDFVDSYEQILKQVYNPVRISK